MTYAVKQLAELAGVSVRTLHYYDEIGLLEPSSYGGNGYRQYNEEALFRLQQILFYRELDFSLSDIAKVIEQPDFDVLESLQLHKELLQGEAKRLSTLIQTIDKTIQHMKGKLEMSDAEIFEGFSEEQQELYAQEAARRWNPETVKSSMSRWKSYSKEKKAEILEEGKLIYQDMMGAMDEGIESETVQATVARWHQHLRNFYEPTPEMLQGLAQMYVDDPAFRAFYEKLHPDMPKFIRDAIVYYYEIVLVKA
ncbi:MAG: MerR family transcriptional regulator [Chloroflexi bacterium]|nr:MAG: MerR family transcriptional regulator [Chloroflexota bacterium]MBL1194119.1 MerR family transcriptional regulator [Chloroflexota bacterium]NOH11412.1 MerR family transcriptional regulator [Chloroflexota bacterium]